MGIVLIGTGAAAVAMGLWRGYASARAALGPLVHNGDPTRTLVEASRPFPGRARVRRFARHAAVSVAWLIVACYGLFLVSAGSATP